MPPRLHRVRRSTRPLPARLAATLVVVTTVLGGCTSGTTPASPASPTRTTTPVAPTTPGDGRPATGIAFTPCESGFECARLPVPVSGTTGATVDLAVTRHRASGSRTGVLLVNPGGPGGSAVDSLQASWQGLPAALAEHFDLVAVDPRGVGRSAPVRCGTTAQLDRYWALDPSPDTPQELADYEQGTADLVATCQTDPPELLAHLSTADGARDMDRLRVALGEERLNYLGYSYGTALGTAYLEAFPGQVRAMVLDGALDPTLTWDRLVDGQARGFDGALSSMLASCEATSCAFRRAVTGELARAYDDLAARIDREPLRTSGDRTVGPGELTLAAGEGLYDQKQGWPALEAALATAVRGDGQGLLALSDAYLDRSSTGYGPLLSSYFAVTCVDTPWPRDPQAYVDLARREAAVAPRFGAAVAMEGLTCATWPVPSTGRPHAVRAPSAPPVVVIGTTDDPATPYAWAQALAGQLASGVLVTHRGEGHTVYRASGPDCLVGPVTDYLVTATPPPALTC